MRAQCPKDSSLIRLFMNEMAPRETEKLLRHLASCSRCAFRFNVLRQVKRDLEPRLDAFVDSQNDIGGIAALRRAAFLSAEGDVAGVSRVAQPRWPNGMSFRFQVAFGLLAVIFVLATSAYLLVLRGQRHSEVRSQSLELTLLAPLGTTSSIPESFRWTPVLNAEDYGLVLIDESLRPVCSMSTFLVTEAMIPRDVRSGLLRDRTYVWTVTASDGDGTLLSSRTGSFIIK